MSWFLAMFTSPSLTQRLEENKKAMRKTKSGIEREIRRMEKQEKELLFKIKQAAKNQHIERAKAMVKNLTRLRGAIKTLYGSVTQIESTMLNLQLVKTTAELTKSMRDSYRVLFILNRQCNLPQLQHLLMQLEKETDVMNMKQELINDATDSMLEGDGDEEEEKRIFNEVMEEVGVQTADAMQDLPVNNNNNTNVLDEDMLNRIAKLQK